MGPMGAFQTGISARVRAQYEAFPYPHYGLFLPLRTQEAYASNSLFAARLLEQKGRAAAIRRAPEARVLLAGCGDVFPYMSSAWEPRAHALTAADLSGRSLRRARLRCLPRARGIEWKQGNLEDADFALPDGLAHIDCYGVLHHLSDPAPVLRRFGAALLPGGTARIMVYNSAARGWLRHAQRALALLGLTPEDRGDPGRARRILEKAAAISPALAGRFSDMGPGAFANDARFVDTFLHAREARLGLAYWLRAFTAAGLEPIGLFDRYGELDDLANPLLEFPGAEALQDRIADRRFENNLEVYLAKAGPSGARTAARVGLPVRHGMRSPPEPWFGYPETKPLPWLMRRRLWSHFLGSLRGPSAPIDAWAGGLPPAALQRLARLGALFPDDFRSDGLRALLLKPLHAFMEPPAHPPAGALRGDCGLRAEVAGLLEGKRLPARRLEAVLARLEAAQRP